MGPPAAAGARGRASPSILKPVKQAVLSGFSRGKPAVFCRAVSCTCLRVRRAAGAPRLVQPAASMIIDTRVQL
jgi:hypothetical protein